MLHSLARMVAYDIATHDKVITSYAEWEQINRDRNKLLRATAKNLADSEKELHQSQGEFNNMQKELDCL